MRESQFVKQWRNEGIMQGSVQTMRLVLRKIARRLEDPIPDVIRLALEWTGDLQTLDRWFDAALDADSIADLRKIMNIPS
jgi:hypothetical protein